jgi:tRNA nucleotidyltransferase (CCA-adding enzyme)
MKAYVVGGAVRDELLGLPLQDKDYVVVGATPEQMVAQGFRPVGKDFPVFLHPQTHEEYALARTERKSGRGYKGFKVYAAPDVTLEDDLRRRDLTINAMAKDPESGALIDPFHGKQDLEKRILRHVSEAFAEDPVRILRVARFAARFGFRVADETMALMREMVRSGEADYLVPERVWQEFERGLAEPHPQNMFAVLEACGAADKLLDGVKPVMPLLEAAARGTRSVPIRFAVIAWPHKEPEVAAVCDRLKAPNEVRELALLACRNRVALRAAPLASAEALLELLKRADAFRRPERFRDLLQVARIGSPGLETERLERAAAAAAAVDGGAIAAKAAFAADIPRLVDEARVRAIEAAA